MPSHPERVRTAALPPGYQFGDAGPGKLTTDYATNYATANIQSTVRVRIPKRWSVSEGPFGDTIRPVRQFIQTEPGGHRHELKPLAFTADRDLGDER